MNDKLETLGRLNNLLSLAANYRQSEKWQELAETLGEAATTAWQLRHLEAIQPLLDILYAVKGEDSALAALSLPRCESVEEHNKFPMGRWS